MPQSNPKGTHHISASLRVESKLRVSQTRRANFDLVKRPCQSCIAIRRRAPSSSSTTA